MYRNNLVDGLVEAGLRHSVALAYIDADFAARAAGVIFLSEVRSPSGTCAVAVASLFGAAIRLRSRRCGNRGVESRAPRLARDKGITVLLGDPHRPAPARDLNWRSASVALVRGISFIAQSLA